MQEVRKDHESTALGKVVSGGRLCASCVDENVVNIVNP